MLTRKHVCHKWPQLTRQQSFMSFGFLGAQREKSPGPEAACCCEFYIREKQLYQQPRRVGRVHNSEEVAPHVAWPTETVSRL